MKKILIADDEVKYRKLIKLFLESANYKVFTAENGLKLLDLYSQNTDAALIILDIMMPEMDGIETCKVIREYSPVPIIMLTALGDINSEVGGLKSGADDYISKPFNSDKLIARVDALIRRTSLVEETQLEKVGIRFNEDSYTIEYNDGSCELTLKEYMLLKLMVINKNQVMLRETLMDKIWGFNYEGDPRTLDTHIKSLRSKTGPLGLQITTVRGKGYYYRSEI